MVFDSVSGRGTFLVRCAILNMYCPTQNRQIALFGLTHERTESSRTQKRQIATQPHLCLNIAYCAINGDTFNHNLGMVIYGGNAIVSAVSITKFILSENLRFVKGDKRARNDKVSRLVGASFGQCVAAALHLSAERSLWRFRVASRERFTVDP